MSEGDVGIYSVHNACMFRGYCRKQADEITALRAALDQERRRLAWIADNASRDVFLDEFWGRFDKGVGADGADDLRAKIDALLSGRGESA